MQKVRGRLRDLVGRAIHNAPAAKEDWYSLSEERREPWRKDADRAIEIFFAELRRVLRFGDELNLGVPAMSDVDACVCGDYRRDHENGTGRCKMPNDLTHGFEPCLKFRLAKAPTPGALR